MNKILCMGVILIAAFLSGCGNMMKGKAAAESQVSVFHERFNAENLWAIVAAAHSDMLKASPATQVTNFIGVVRRKLGKVTDSQEQSWKMNTFNGATTVVLVQNTTFEQGKGRETFTFRVQQDKANLLGYDINSQDLIMQ